MICLCLRMPKTWVSRPSFLPLGEQAPAHQGHCRFSTAEYVRSSRLSETAGQDTILPCIASTLHPNARIFPAGLRQAPLRKASHWDRLLSSKPSSAYSAPYLWFFSCCLLGCQSVTASKHNFASLLLGCSCSTIGGCSAGPCPCPCWHCAWPCIHHQLCQQSCTNVASSHA